MRMDRYEEELNNNDLKQTRTNKNQELYTDVYLNNIYVSVDNLKEVMEENEEDYSQNIKLKKENKIVNYNYEDKNYDIVSIIDEAIKNKKDDNLKRSIDANIFESNKEINSLIESIEENNNKKEEEQELLADLLPNDENTEVISLSKPIDPEDVGNIKEEDNLNLDIKDEFNDKDLEIDDSFLEKKSFVKVIIMILSIILVLGVILGILIYKDII